LLLRRTLASLGLTLVASVVPTIAFPTAASAAPTLAFESHFNGWDRASSPVIADIDGNGIDDVVVGHEDGWVKVFRDGTNAYMPGWPQPAIISGNNPTAIESSPTVADLDRDGAPEIIMGVGSTFVANQPGGIVVFNRNGSVRCRWAGIDNMRVWGMIASPDGYPEGVFATPAVGDVDGDGYPDMVFGGWDSYIHVVNRNCQETVPRFFNDDTIWSSPSLYDVDGDGRMEIFTGGDSHAGPSEHHPGGMVRALDWRNGQLVLMWKQKPMEVIHSSVAIGDINGDGRLEVVHGAGDFYLGQRGNNPDSFKVFAWHVEDGSPVPGWPQSTGGVTWSSPTLADLTGDGVVEVVIGSRDHNVHAWRGNGQKLWTSNPAHPGGVSTPVQGSAMVGDVTGDGLPEVVIGTGWGMFILNGANGSRIGNPLYVGLSHETTPALGNFNGHWRIVTAGFDTPNNFTKYRWYDIPAPKATPEWPMWRKNARRLGANPSDGPPLPPGVCRKPSNPPATPSAASAKGYWFLGKDGGIFSFNAPFHGSLPGLGIRTQVRNMAGAADGNGYWILGQDGGVFAFGSARFFGNTVGLPLVAPIISLTPTPDGLGYWLLAADGGVFSYGSARFYGSTGGMKLNGPIISMAAAPDGKGYWLLGSDGGIFSYGSAKFYGSMGGQKLNAPVVSMAPSPTGYWLLGGDGGVFSFNAPFTGSVPGTGLCSTAPGVQLRGSSTGKGYWILGADGGVFSFGDALFYGSFPGLPADRAAIDMAIRR
jgi:FG-GAP-like repeat